MNYFVILLVNINNLLNFKKQKTKNKKFEKRQKSIVNY